MQGIVYVDQTFAAKPHAPLPSVVVERSKPTGLETRSILFPLHFQDHSWALAKLNVATRVIQLYDPMSSSKRFEVAEDNLRSFLSSQESGRWQIESFEEDMDFTQRNVALIASWSDAYSVRGHEIRLCGKLKEMRVLVDNVDNVLELAKIMGILSEGAFEFASHMEVLMNELMIRREVVFLLSDLQKPSAVSKDILVSEQRVIEDDLDTLRKVMGGGAREVVSATAARQAEDIIGEHFTGL
ncbi:hypothetical protein K4K53_007160 [Colletotrichum sp. SAR 10_77]|nr:hypothetical protein K4K53_007160 [Colletotrichum sp. SAR 10_77]KAJ4997069.1 hypothetical protein K4K48_007451 [Colletotrichum sp. SAR 10_66]